MTGPKTCLVVGGYGAIGGATTELLRDHGWHCVVSSSRAGVAGADAEIDLTRPDMFGQSVAGLPELDGVVIAAGAAPSRSLAETEAAHIEYMLAVNLTGPALLVKALRPRLRPGSAIVLFSSIALAAGSYDPAYAAAKGGVAALGRTLARELAPSSRVNILAPGLVAGTPVFESMTEDFRRRHLDRSLLHRVASLQECAVAVEFLLTHPHLTAVVLSLDGGRLP